MADEHIRDEYEDAGNKPAIQSWCVVGSKGMHGMSDHAMQNVSGERIHAERAEHADTQAAQIGEKDEYCIERDGEPRSKQNERDAHHSLVHHPVIPLPGMIIHRNAQ